MRTIYYFFMLRIMSGLNWTGFKYFFFGREYDVTDEDIKTACNYLLTDRYVGLCFRDTHFSSYPITLAHWLLTGDWMKWSHAWINVDDMASDSKDLVIYESVAKGLIKSPFWKVLNCDAIVLLKPKYLANDEWYKVTEYLNKKLGTHYDAMLNEKNDDELDCIETVVNAILSANPKALPNISRMMKNYGQLTPQMALYGDFTVALKIRR